MKNTKRIICLALCILTVVTIFTACGIRKTPPAEETTASENVTSEKPTKEDPVTIEEPSKETEKQTEKETTKKEETTTKKAETITTKPYTPPSTTKKQDATTKKQESTTKKQETTTKKQESTTKKPEATTTKPVTTEPTAYSCGSANHHCTTKEEHAFIVSLEEKGCPICSSHSCKSFYALDEWGNPCYDITRCPKYSEKKDPANTCEHCGREVGIGDNGTCVRFTVETKCPICGKTVPAKTCHTH